MSARLMPGILFAGGVTLFASVWLPWDSRSCASDRSSDLFDFLCFGSSNDGLAFPLGQVFALASVAVAVLAGTAWARPQLVGRLPLGQAVLFALYAGAATFAEHHANVENMGFSPDGPGAGPYVGLAGGLLALLAVVIPNARELLWDRTPSRLLGLAAIAGLLGVFIGSWATFDGDAWVPGVAFGPASVASALALRLPSLWWSVRRGWPLEALLLASGVVALTAAATLSFAAAGGHVGHRAWLGVGLAVAVLIVALVDLRGQSGALQLRPRGLAAAAGATLLVLGISAPWQRFCEAGDPAGGGSCVTATGWWLQLAPSAALLAVGCGIVLARSANTWLSGLDLAVPLAVAVAAIGLEMYRTPIQVEILWGPPVTFAATALVCVAALWHVRIGFGRVRLPVAVPVALSCLLLLAIVLPMLAILPEWSRRVLGGGFGVFDVAGVLVTMRLLRLWCGQAPMPRRGAWLVGLPLVLLVLQVPTAVANAITAQDFPGFWSFDWGLELRAGLCLALLAFGLWRCGWAERLRVPSLLRFDRL